jgi:hypothetical protein
MDICRERAQRKPIRVRRTLNAVIIKYLYDEV